MSAIKRALKAVYAFFEGLFCKKAEKKIPSVIVLPQKTQVSASIKGDLPALTYSVEKTARVSSEKGGFPEKKKIMRLTLESTKKPLISKTPSNTNPPAKVVPRAVKLNTLPRGILPHVASFLDGHSQIQLSHVNRNLYKKSQRLRTVFSYNPSMKGFFEKFGEQEFNERFSKIKTLILDDYFTPSQEIFGYRSITKCVLEDDLVESIVSAAQRGAFSRLQRIFFNYRIIFDQTKEISEKSLIALIKAFPKLQCIDIMNPLEDNESRVAKESYNERYSTEVIKALANHCPDLRVVRFPNPNYFKRHPALTPDELKKCLKKWPKLEVIHCPYYFTDEHLAVIQKNCPNLQGISFPRSHHYTPKQLLNLMRECKQLRTFSCNGSVYWSLSSFVKEIRENRPELRNLKLSRCPDYFGDTVLKALAESPLLQLKSLVLRDVYTNSDEVLAALFAAFPDLEELSLDFISPTNSLTDAFLSTLGDSCPKLRKLHFRTLPSEITQTGFIQLIKKLPHLVSLNIPKYLVFNDELILAIAENCPCLRFLDLSHSGKPYCEKTEYKKRGAFSPEALKVLGKKCPNLKFVHTRCTNFTRQPTLEEMQEFFPNLSMTSEFAYHAWTGDFPDSHYGFLTEEGYDRNL